MPCGPLPEKVKEPVLSIAKRDVVPAAPLEMLNRLDAADDAVSVNAHVTPGNATPALFHVFVTVSGLVPVVSTPVAMLTGAECVVTPLVASVVKLPAPPVIALAPTLIGFVVERSVPLVGSVIAVGAVIVKVVRKFPTVVKGPATVISDVFGFATPVPPLNGVTGAPNATEANRVSAASRSLMVSIRRLSARPTSRRVTAAPATPPTR